MRKLLLTAAAMAGLFTLTAPNALAAPSAGLQAAPAHNMVTNVDYAWRHRH